MAEYCARGSYTAAKSEHHTIVHSAGQPPRSAPQQKTSTSREPPRRHRRLERRYLERTGKDRISCNGTELRRCTYPVKAGLLLLVGAILVSPITTGLTSGSRMGMGVFAAPCSSGTTTTSAATGEGAVEVNVTRTAGLNLTNMFNCEGGDFEVNWFGEVNVTGTIVIGAGTTVTILGDDNYSQNNSSLSDQEGLMELTDGLALPLGLTSAAVGVAPLDIAANTSTNTSFGPLFRVEGGRLIISDLIVRGGFAVNTTNALDGIGGDLGIGGGIYAINSNVSVARCEFSNNFAEHYGGGIFANSSTVAVKQSLFSSCRAGFESTFEDEDLEGRGGAIAVEMSELLVDGCLFESGYAKFKGAGVYQQTGSMSVLGSVFYGNVAGGGNVISEDEAGEGADLSIKDCTRSFNGLAACGANDTMFYNSHVGKKGGSVAIGSSDEPLVVAFHRCIVNGSSAGGEIEDEPQGDGGAFSVNAGTTLLLADCILTHNYCGKKGGAIMLARGYDWIREPGSSVILRDSFFESNTADLDNGGVVNAADFTTVFVEGHGNVFKTNGCGADGAVFAATSDTSLIIEGGTYEGNSCGGTGGVFWSRGNLSIEGGLFIENSSPEAGGVLFASEFGVTTVKGGVFENNTSEDGAVALVSGGSVLRVEGGVFTGNFAERQGGVFSANDLGVLQITGGNFTNNMGDNGGFLFKEGEGETSCKGASVLEHQGVNGGAIHAVDGATLDWACDIGNNSALSGPAIYARDNATVKLRDISLFGNTVDRGSVVFVVGSVLQTYGVEIVDYSRSPDLSAVQLDHDSRYMAEDTSFVGFEGEAVVFSEGELFLDDCDFSGCNASVLVYSEPNSIGVIRNAALGDLNFAVFADAGSEAGELPDATSLTNANMICGDGGGDHSSTSPPVDFPCSQGSACLNGNLGVYCQCYTPQLPNSTERCVSGDASALNIARGVLPEETYFPGLLEGTLILSYEPTSSSSATSGVSSGSSNDPNERGEDGGDDAVMWNVEAVMADASMMSWTILPSTGLIVPGEIITLRVATLPGTYFDGTSSVLFQAVDVGATPLVSTLTALSDDGGYGDRISNSTATNWTQGGDKSSSPGEWAPSALKGASTAAETSNAASFDVTFFHCAAGSFWNRTDSSATSTAEYTGNCEPCSENEMDGQTQGVDCSHDGETLQTLSVKKGYWRAKLDLSSVRECFNEDACKGGSNVSEIEEYCNDGYEGVVCSVCSSGYGRGAANQCHECTEDFKGGVFFLLSVAVLFALGVVSLLSVYLVGGKRAVTSTVASTRRQVVMLQRRSVRLLSRSDGGGLIDFTGKHDAKGGRAGFSSAIKVHPWRREADKASTRDVSLIRTSSSSNGINNNGKIIAGLNCVSDGGALAPKARVSQGPTVSPRDLNSGGVFTPNILSQNHANASGGLTGEPSVVSANNTATSPRPVHGQAFGGPAVAALLDGQERNERNEPLQTLHEDNPEREEPTAARRIGVFLSGLPLSKLKIVIVVWQISGAFADVTNVGFPPIYENFLSIIGVFSLDLGWLLSASCVASGIGFYEKLLTVTIGPVILLCLLGVTFHFGARPARPRMETLDEVSERTRYGRPRVANGRHGSSITTEPRSAAPFDTSDVTASSLAPIPGRETSEQEVNGASPNDSDTPPADLPLGTISVQASWILHVNGNGTRGAERTSSVPPESRMERPNVASGRSLRSIWKAGPGDKTDLDQIRLWELFARHTTMTLIVLYLVYSQVSTVVFQTFACDDYPEIDKRYLRADGRIECNTATHTAYVVYASIMICLYPFGIPAAFCYLLVRQRSAINPPSDKYLKDSRGKRHVVEGKLNQRLKNESVAPTSFLWNPYYPNRYYYEVFECMRRLLLTGLLVFVPNTSAQVAYGCIFAFISLLAFELQRPHIDALEIQLYRTGCLVIFFTNFLALIIQAELADKDSSGSAVYSVLLILVHVFFLLSIGWNSWATMKSTMEATFSRRHVQGVVLGVDLVGGDSANNLSVPSRANVGNTSSSNDSEYKEEDEEAPPTWQDQPTIPAHHVGISGNGSSLGTSRWAYNDQDKHLKASAKSSPTGFPPAY